MHSNPGEATSLPAERSRSRSRSRTRHVAIVSTQAETLDELQSYLRRAGFAAYGTRELDPALLARSGLTAVVLFPDEFDVVTVLDAVDRLLRAPPTALPVLVTREPRRFEALVARCAGAGAMTPVILSKPAWGWSILDTLRGRDS